MAGMGIIGAGQACGEAAYALREGEYTGELTIIGDEQHPSYPARESGR